MPEIDEKAFRKHLEWLVDLLPEESGPYFEERPRFVHAVLVLADDAHSGEIIKASCIKQLDPEIIERRTKITQITETEPDSEYILAGGQTLAKNNDLIDSGIHENQMSSEEDNEKSEPSELIRPTPQLNYVPLSKHVRIGQQEKNLDTPPSEHKNQHSSGHYSQGYLINNKLGEEREEAMFVGKDGNHRLHTGTSRFEDNKDSQNVDGQKVKTGDYYYRIPQLQGTVYERPEIVSRTYRSHVEETTFPSIDRYRSVRSETIRFEPRSPRSLLNPLDRTSTDTYTATSTPQPNNDAIAQAVQILQSSCDMLDETVDRIQRRKLLGQNSNFSFPSENRQTTA